MNRPRVSVIMATYNRARYLPEAIDSLLRQTYQNFELIIVDDGSVDKTKIVISDYIRKYPNKIRYFYQENRGQAAARNAGIRQAKGECIAILDSDDIALPTRLEKQVKYLDENSEVGLLGTRCIDIDNNGNERPEVLVSLGRDNIRRDLLLKSCFCNSSTMFRKSCIEKVGYYNETLRNAEDYDLWLRLSDICEVDNYPEVLQKWRRNTKTGISAIEAAEQSEYTQKIRERHLKRKLKRGRIDYSCLLQLVRSKPFDKLIISFFFAEYKKLKQQNTNDRLTYLQLRYLHENTNRWKYLNEIAQLYIKQNKKSLAFMCLAESLRLNPEQAEVFQLAESLQEHIKPKFPNRLTESRYTVSVILRTYNRKEELKLAIQSVLNQTFRDYELIVINDGGTDEVEGIVDSFHLPKIRYYKLEKNKGRAAALNEGVLRAQGKYIVYLDDDDIYYPNHLETLVAAIENSEYKIVFTKMQKIKGMVENNKFKPLAFLDGHNKEFSKEDLILRSGTESISFMHERDIFNDIGLFNEDLATAEDWEFWLRCSLRFDFLRLNQTTREWRIKHDNSIVNNVIISSFCKPLYQRFYALCQGKIGYIKYYLKQGKDKEAYVLFKDIAGNYKNYFKTPLLFEELIKIAQYFRDSRFLSTLTKDYFLCDAESCLKGIIRARVMRMFFDIVPALPSKILKYIKKRLK